MKRTGPTNIHLQGLIQELNRLGRDKNINLWRRIAEDLSKSTRSRREVNIDKIVKHTNDGEIALVPGKVLGIGDMTKKLTVAGWKFSKSAEDKINKNGRAISIETLIKENPGGKKVRIIG
ncbi:MAG: 50S ribosomal protein L18e [Candidatus Woesearchaeota archaeon]|nr:MAG: 50S ribosomal protein L18e [Candidatus Woesearchaeota archaeon]